MADLKKIVMLIVVLINIIIFNFIYKLEKNKCECGNKYKKDFIKYYTLLTIFIGILFIMGFLKVFSHPILKLVSTIYSVLGLANVYLLFRLTQNLVIKKCTCSDTPDRAFVYYYSMVVISVYVILITILLFKSLFRKEMAQFKAFS
jgi:hypothetical protein